MTNTPHDWVLFLGRFHPLLVHLPIGGIVLLCILELLAKFTRFKDAAQCNRLILAVVAVAAIAAAALGLMLSQSGGYDPQLLPLHKWTGLAVTAASAVTWILHRAGRPRAYRLSLLATFALLIVASHLGGSLTHGRDYLIHYAPPHLRALLEAHRPAVTAPGSKTQLTEREVFEGLIQPILQSRCSACHGPEKHKAGLSMETYESLIRGGDDGPVLVANRPLDSLMIQRLLLPPDEDDHMPPQGKPQPTMAEIATLEWWIEQGAPAGRTVGSLKPGPEIQHILSAAQAASQRQSVRP